MNEIELRKYCLDKSIEILSWYKNFFPSKELHPLAISEILYRYLTTGQIEYFELPHTVGKATVM
jgi:hypothetical protein